MGSRSVVPVLPVKGESLTKSIGHKPGGPLVLSKATGVELGIVELRKAGLSPLEISQAISVPLTEIRQKLGDWGLLDNSQ